MQNKIISLILCCLSAPVYSGVTIEHWQTTQKTPVFFVSATGLPMVDIRVIFDAGSARDGYQQGLAALTCALLGSGAADWNADAIAQRFASVGAQFSTGASKDMSWLSLRSLSEQEALRKSLQTLRAIVSKPSFAAVDFEREKQRTLARLKRREESPGTLASLAFSKQLYKTHPYANPSAGIIETVSGFALSDVQDFYQRHYVASNAMVVMVGDLSKQQALRTAEFLIADLAIGSKPPALPKTPAPSQGVRQHIEFASTQTHIVAGLVGIHRQHPDYFSLYVGNHILGGGGFSSRLFREIREKRGLAYSAYSYFSPSLRKGSFVMGLQTRNDQTAQAIQIMQTTLAQFLKHGPSAAELLAAKKNINGGFAMRFDTNSELVGYVSMIGFHRLALDYLDLFQQRVEAVTLASIKAAFKRRIKPENIHIISVGASAE